MTPTNLSGKTALVTGSSSGLGADFARELASRGCGLVLAARREDKLQALQQELSSRFSVPVQVIPADLCDEAERLRLFALLEQNGTPVDILVNNAGFGLFGPVAELSWEKQRQMLSLNIEALTHLTRLFLPGMLARREGYFLQVASIGAFLPTPTYAVYAATKSYVMNFSEALNYELRGSGVSSTVVSPGVTATEFFKVAGQKLTLYQRLSMMSSPEVTRIAVRAMLHRKALVVPGWFNALSARFLYHFTPRRLATAIGHWTMNTR